MLVCATLHFPYHNVLSTFSQIPKPIICVSHEQLCLPTRCLFCVFCLPAVWESCSHILGMLCWKWQWWYLLLQAASLQPNLSDRVTLTPQKEKWHVETPCPFPTPPATNCPITTHFFPFIAINVLLSLNVYICANSRNQMGTA